MDFGKIGANIRNIRETEIQKTREELAEEIGISPITIARLENGTSKVTNIETYYKISALSGHTLEELLLVKSDTNDRQKIERKIDYLLSVVSIEELNYIYDNINMFIKFIHKGELRTLKDIKKETKQKFEKN